VCDEDVGDVRYGQIFTTQLSDRPHGHTEEAIGLVVFGALICVFILLVAVAAD
jgi:hypothetical protein